MRLMREVQTLKSVFNEKKLINDIFYIKYLKKK